MCPTCSTLRWWQATGPSSSIAVLYALQVRTVGAFVSSALGDFVLPSPLLTTSPRSERRNVHHADRGVRRPLHRDVAHVERHSARPTGHHIESYLCTYSLVSQARLCALRPPATLFVTVRQVALCAQSKSRRVPPHAFLHTHIARSCSSPCAQDSLRNSIQVPVETYITRVVWPFVRAHYLLLSPVILLSSFFVVPFLGVYLLLGAAWTVAFHASFLVRSIATPRVRKPDCVDFLRGPAADHRGQVARERK